jgi:hypothetical protein
MKKIAASLRHHRSLILNWFRARGTISAGSVEGLNNKAKLTIRSAFGFRTLEAVKIALSHARSAPSAEIHPRILLWRLSVKSPDAPDRLRPIVKSQCRHNWQRASVNQQFKGIR